MAAVKPDKIREEIYDFVVAGLQEQGFAPVGRSKEGLVYENHVDEEHVVVKVIKKKNQVPQEELGEITTYEEKIAQYEAEKKEKTQEKEAEDTNTEEAEEFTEDKVGVA